MMLFACDVVGIGCFNLPSLSVVSDMGRPTSEQKAKRLRRKYGCGIAFCRFAGLKSDVRAHWLTTHAEEDQVPFRCTECDNRFDSRTRATNHLAKFHPAHEFNECFAGTLSEDTTLAPKMLVNDDEYAARRADYACPENVQHSPAEWKQLFQSPKANPNPNPDEAGDQPGDEPGPPPPKKAKSATAEDLVGPVSDSDDDVQELPAPPPPTVEPIRIRKAPDNSLRIATASETCQADADFGEETGAPDAGHVDKEDPSDEDEEESEDEEDVKDRDYVATDDPGGESSSSSSESSSDEEEEETGKARKKSARSPSAQPLAETPATVKPTPKQVSRSVQVEEEIELFAPKDAEVTTALWQVHSTLEQVLAELRALPRKLAREMRDMSRAERQSGRSAATQTSRPKKSSTAGKDSVPTRPATSTKPLASTKSSTSTKHPRKPPAVAQSGKFDKAASSKSAKTSEKTPPSKDKHRPSSRSPAREHGHRRDRRHDHHDQERRHDHRDRGDRQDRRPGPSGDAHSHGHGRR